MPPRPRAHTRSGDRSARSPTGLRRRGDGRASRRAPASCSATGRSHCNLRVLADSHGRPLAASAPSGYGPTDLQSAYALAAAAASNGGSQTVAIVDAYDDKTAEADLGVYRSTYGLPACTTANGCFKKVNQNGVQGSYPTNDQG